MRTEDTPIPRFTVITLGVSDMRASIAFYEALGFARKFRATGEAVASSTPAAPCSRCFRGINSRRRHAAGPAAAKTFRG